MTTWMPVLRQKPFYPGQFGVPGSDVSLGIRSAPRGIVLYVDSGHPNAVISNDGTDPEAPLPTIDAAINSPLLVTNSVIIIQPGDYAESVQTPNYATGPSYITVMGQPGSEWTPYWSSAAANTPCLIVRAPGWRFFNIRFGSPTGAPAVVCACTQAPYTANDIAIRTEFHGCHFYGATTGLGGIQLHGAPYECVIADCVFGFHHNGGGTAYGIGVQNTGYADAYRCRIERCVFYENDKHIARPGGAGSFNVSLIKDCQFLTDGAFPATVVIDLRNATQGHNMVTGCALMGDYSNAGGYYDTAAGAGFWGGNVSNDLPEAEVGDNGLTIAPPAA